jgi:hypothetical protein
MQDSKNPARVKKLAEKQKRGQQKRGQIYFLHFKSAFAEFGNAAIFGKWSRIISFHVRRNTNRGQ